MFSFKPQVLPPQSGSARPGITGVAGCAAMAVAAVLVHGYHLGADDAAIWVPAIKKAADPSLYPFGGEFFLTHAHFSLFPFLLGSLIRLMHVPADAAIFLFHLFSVFLLLLASRRLLSACFGSERACWSGVALLAAVLSVPVAGTALPIMDPYVTSRSLSTPLALLAIAWYLSERPLRAMAWIAACGLIHPQMCLYAVTLLGMMELSRRLYAVPEPLPAFGLLALLWLPLPWDLSPPGGPAGEALLSRTYFFVSNWTWYEWLGVIAPLLLLWGCSQATLRSARPQLAELLKKLAAFGALFTAAGLFLVSSPRLENYNRLQPMRAFQLLYVLMFLVAGALAGEYILKDKPWRWLALFGPLAAGMWIAGWAAFPDSPHVEWPGAVPRGDWNSAFLWVRMNTPKDAIFAMDPAYLLLPGEDMHGFRAVAERSALADRVKDSGAVSLFPQLAGDWDQQVQAQEGWEWFSLADFHQLARRFHVTWIVTLRPAPAGLDCPYRDAALEVCRIGHPADASMSASRMLK